MKTNLILILYKLCILKVLIYKLPNSLFYSLAFNIVFTNNFNCRYCAKIIYSLHCCFLKVKYWFELKYINENDLNKFVVSYSSMTKIMRTVSVK